MGPTPETCGELIRALRHVVDLRQAALHRLHHTDDAPPQAAFWLLAELGYWGESRVSELAQHRVIDASVVSRQVARLEQAGLITRRRDPTDKRVSLLRATADGEQALAELERRKTEWLSAALDDWEDDKVRDLAELLGEVRDAMCTSARDLITRNEDTTGSGAAAGKGAS